MTGAGGPPEARPAPRAVPRPSLSQQVRRSPATFGLIAVTSAIFALQELSFLSLGYDLPANLGAKINAEILAGQVWRLITPLFLHAGLWHLFVNMYSLYALGPAVERLFGWRRMLVLYFLSGAAGVELSLAFSAANSLGASGAIFGLLGALGAFLYLHRKTLGRSAEVHLRQIAFVALINLALGLMPGIDNWAHLGGLLCGATLAAVLGPRFVVTFLEDGRIELREQRPWRQVRQKALMAVAGVAILGILAAVVRANL